MPEQGAEVVANSMQWNGIEANVRELVLKVETVDFAATPRGVRVRRRAEQAVALIGPIAGDA